MSFVASVVEPHRERGEKLFSRRRALISGIHERNNVDWRDAFVRLSIVSLFLQELDVSRCQLAYLSASAFVGVPRIISLNVSNNQFLQLPTQAIAPLRSLRRLYADG